MLAITETAAQAINTLVASSDLPEGAGLRIASQADEQSEGLALSVAPAPADDDTVLQGGGANVFLEPTAAQVLDEMVLDVQAVPDETGAEKQYQFAISPQS